jgi:5'-AMP-activated protein kinase regulatory beta subunit
MKKPASLEQNRFSQTSGVASRQVIGATTVKLPRSRRTKIKQPMALLEEHCSDGELRPVCFDYFNSDANEVFLVGSFNDWQQRTTGMTKQHGGKWSKELLLKPGQYEYRFVVDGRWQDDPMATRFATNPFGSLNSVVEVKAS